MAGELPTNADIAARLAAARRPAGDRGRHPPPRARVPPRGGAGARHQRVGGGARDAGPGGGAGRHRRTLQSKIVELVETGEISALQKARERIPEGLAAVARIDGIGPKRAAALWSALGITSVDDLAAALAEDRLSGVAGIGPGTRQRIADGIQKAAEPDPDEGRIPLGRALPVAEALRDELRAAVPGARVEIAGSLRRGRETAHDIDIVATAADPRALVEALPGLPSVLRVLSGGDAAVAVRTHSGLRAEVAVVPRRVVRQPAAARHRVGGAQRPPPRDGRPPRPLHVAARDRRPGRHRHPRRRGGRLRRPRPRVDPARAARGLRRARGGRAGAAARAGDARGPAGRAALAHHVERRHARRGGHGRGGPPARLPLPGDQRPLPEPRHGRRPRPRARAPPVGGDPRGGRPARRHHGAPRDRGGHPRRRAHRLRRRAAGGVRLGHREPPLRAEPAGATRSPPGCSRRWRARSSTRSATPPAG